MLVSYKGQMPEVAPSAFVEESARVIGNVSIGKDSSVWFNVVIRGDVNCISIGDCTNIQDGTVVHVSSQTHSTVIGNEVTIGHNATLHGCTVGDRCLIGMGSIILDGAVVGEESMVAAGSVVAPGSVVPPGSLFIGSPARFKRQLTESEINRLRCSAAHYVLHKQTYLCG
jgi:gamma-carbonic anhydrase